MKKRNLFRSISLFLTIGALLIVAPLAYLGLTNITKVHADWYNSAWSYRMAITFGNSGSAVTDQKVLIQYNTASLISANKLQSACQDIRFTDAGGKILQFYNNTSGGAGVGCNDASTDFYVLMPSIVAGNNLIYIYYGNPSAVAGTTTANFGNTTFSPTSGPTVAGEEQSPGPVAVWHFDEGQGSVANDASGHTNSLTLTSTAWATSSASLSTRTQYLKFNGATSVASRANDTDFDFAAGSFSISAWIRHASTIVGTDVLLTKYNTQGWKVYMNSSGFICLGIDDDNTYGPDDSACSSASYADSAWHHIEAVKVGTSSITVYVDGNQVAQTTSLTATATLSTNATLYVGADSAGNTNWWDGWVDDIAIYPYARTANQVKLDVFGSSEASRSAVILGANTKDPLTDGLVGYWKMDEASWNGSANEVIDHSGMRSFGTATGAVTPPSTGIGKFANAGSFDGTEDYVTMGDVSSLDVGSNFSLAFWINPTTVSSSQYILSKWNTSSNRSYLVQLIAGGYVRLYNSSNGSDAPVAIDSAFGALAANTWKHVVISKQGTTVNLYVDGVLNSTAAGATDTYNSTAQFILGSNDGGSSFFSGKLDDVRIYNRALVSSEIRQLYAWAPGPVGYWDLNENTGSTAYDISGNGKNGTFNGSNYWSPGKFGSAANFITNNDYIDLGTPGPLDGVTSFSVSSWIYKGESGNFSNYQGIFGFGDTNQRTPWVFGAINTVVLQGQFETTTGGAGDCAVTSGAISSGVWMYMTFQWDGTTCKILINGLLSGASDTTTGTILANSNGTNYIGKISGFDSWRGKMDDIRFYNYTRTSSQIIEDMNAGHPLGGSPVGSAIIHLKFDEMQGSTVNNVGFGGSGYNGAISGATWYAGGRIGGGITTATSANFINSGDQTFVDSATGLTIGFWVKPLVLATNKALISKSNMSNQNSFAVVTDNAASDEIRVHIPTGVSDVGTYFLTSNLNLVVDTWSYVSVIYNSSEPASSRVRVYKDGKEISGSVTGTLPTSLTTGTTSLIKIGASDSGSYTALNAIYDDIKLYSLPLTYEQMLIDYNGKNTMVLGSLSTHSDGMTASSSASRASCVPGDTSTCRAPVAWWKMDDNTGTTSVDSSGNGSTLTFANGPVWDAGKYGSGIHQNGSNSYLTTTADKDMLDFRTGSFSIFGWEKSRKTSTDDMIFFKGAGNATDKGYDFTPDTSSTGRLQLYISDGSSYIVNNLTGTSDVVDGRWHYIGFTWDPSVGAKIYVDGKLENSASASTAVDINSTLPMLIGGYSSTNFSLDGTVDDVKAYDYVRTPAQIAWDYNRGAPVAWWKMDECQGSTLNDSSGNGNSGTLTIGATGTNATVGTCSGASTEAWKNGAVGKFGAGMYFDGTDDYGSVSSLSSFSLTNFTTTAWIKTTDAGASIIRQQNGANYWLMGTSSLYLSYNGSDDGAVLTTKGPIIGDGTWHHIAIVRDTSALTVTYYVDGKNVGSIASGTNAYVIVNPVYIASHVGTSQFLIGQLDDLRLYNYALTLQQLRMVMNEGAAVRFGP